MSTSTRTRRSTACRAVVGLSAASMLSLPVVALSAAPSQAAEKEKRCAGAQIQLEVEREDGRHEIDADIDDARANERWRIVLKRDGKRFTKVVRRADGDGEISIDRNRKNGKGKDVYLMRAKNLRTGGGCAVKVTMP